MVAWTLDKRAELEKSNLYIPRLVCTIDSASAIKISVRLLVSPVFVRELFHFQTFLGKQAIERASWRLICVPYQEKSIAFLPPLLQLFYEIPSKQLSWRTLQPVVLDISRVLLVYRLQSLGLASAVLVESDKSELVLWIYPEQPRADSTQLPRVLCRSLRILEEFVKAEHPYASLLVPGECWVVFVVAGDATHLSVGLKPRHQIL